MTSSAAARVYRIFKRAEGAPPVRSIVIAMILTACMLTALGVIRVTRQHDVLRLGYQLDREAEQVRQLREVKRRLEVELATLTAPERIRRLATQLGMTTVAPDKIRIVDVPYRKKVAQQ
jgi:cell division protein FtsL